ncbi:MAG: FKBP-type peptidyl-prolyl cis-trans isomerase [Pseudomonadota bacterium]
MSESDNKTAENQAFSSDIEKVSYLLAFNRTQDLMKQTANQLDQAAYEAGVSDALSESANRLAFVDFNSVLPAFQNAIDKARNTEFADVIDAGNAYRQAYAAKEGVVKLPSGLLYRVIESGDGGAKPTLTDTVTTHYHGTFTDGEVFDSSVERDSPASFPVNGVIAGWTEALQLMSVGDKWELVIPPELAYGPGGRGGIPPHSTLVFEVELIKIGS